MIRSIFRSRLALFPSEARYTSGTRAMRAAATALAAATFVFAPALVPGVSAVHAQAVYPSAEAAANAFVDALASSDHEQMKHVLGNDFEQFIPTQNIGQEDVYDFLGAWAQGHQIVPDAQPVSGKASAHLAVGTSGWTMPIPIVERARGWSFDAHAAQAEILTRRIGRNERAAMLTALAYVDAQRDYHGLAQHYAQRFVSTPGTHDGLYWPVQPGEAESPLGPLAATMPHDATVAPKEGYHGYHFRILTAQGSHAKGGAHTYIQDGVMTEGFGLVAWPVEYGKTGVMSFIVDQDGQLYQKNLGANGARIAASLKAFDPDSSWQPTAP